MTSETKGPIAGMRWEPSRRLNDREWEVWELVGSGMGNEDIAEKLGYTRDSVRHLVASLLMKLGVPDGSARRVRLALMFPKRP